MCLTTRRWAAICSTVLWPAVAGCGGASSRGLCEGVACDQPPPAVCLDAERLRRYASPGACDPADGQCRYPAEDRSCAQGCEDGACLGEPDGDFLLEVPAGTALCSLPKGEQSSLDVFELYASQGRVRLQPGIVRLYRDRPSFEASWIDEVLLGPERETLAPAGPGRFDRLIQGTPDDGSYLYGFQQGFDAGEGSYLLDFHLAFEVAGGLAAQGRLVLDAATLGDDGLDFTGSLLDAEERIVSSRRYTDCSYAAYRLIEYDVGAANGDALQLDLMRIRSSMEQNMNTALAGAVFSRDGARRQVDDPFHLVYSSYGHNWAQCFLVVLDEPLEEVCGLYLEEEIDQGSNWQPLRLHYLDADLAILHTQEIVDFETRWGD
ncbi:MAG: hypothetical protein JXR96_19055 [Deltaproteobacteria bacterium]|nr:hypothetical protein [Deltaproteobacteria bacterium]